MSQAATSQGSGQHNAPHVIHPWIRENCRYICLHTHGEDVASHKLLEVPAELTDTWEFCRCPPQSDGYRQVVLMLSEPGAMDAMTVTACCGKVVSSPVE